MHLMKKIKNLNFYYSTFVSNFPRLVQITIIPKNKAEINISSLLQSLDNTVHLQSYKKIKGKALKKISVIFSK
jgi:hypothetical protein